MQLLLLLLLFTIRNSYYAVPKNIHSHPKDEHWKFTGGWGGYQNPKFLKESMNQKWNFQRGRGSDYSFTAICIGTPLVTTIPCFLFGFTFLFLVALVQEGSKFLPFLK